MADSPLACGWAIVTAPVYLICPCCGHPALIPQDSVGTRRLCRQCYCPYFVKDCTSMTAEVEAWSPDADLLHGASGAPVDDEMEAAIYTALHTPRPTPSALAG